MGCFCFALKTDHQQLVKTCVPIFFLSFFDPLVHARCHFNTHIFKDSLKNYIFYNIANDNIYLCR